MNLLRCCSSSNSLDEDVRNGLSRLRQLATEPRWRVPRKALRDIDALLPVLPSSVDDFERPMLAHRPRIDLQRETPSSIHHRRRHSRAFAARPSGCAFLGHPLIGRALSGRALLGTLSPGSAPLPVAFFPARSSSFRAVLGASFPERRFRSALTGRALTDSRPSTDGFPSPPPRTYKPLPRSSTTEPDPSAARMGSGPE